MNRRHAHALAQPTLVIHRDEFEPACSGRWDVYDMLIDPKREDRHRLAYAAREARAICSECPLLEACHADPANAEWLHTMVRKAKPTVSEKRHQRNKTSREVRLDALKAAIDEGVSVEEAVERTGSPSAKHLYKWCHRNDLLPLWYELVNDEPRQVPAKCGTTAGRQVHRRKGEDACQACNDAAAAYQRRMRAIKRGAAA